MFSSFLIIYYSSWVIVNLSWGVFTKNRFWKMTKTWPQWSSHYRLNFKDIYKTSSPFCRGKDWETFTVFFNLSSDGESRRFTELRPIFSKPFLQKIKKYTKYTRQKRQLLTCSECIYRKKCPSTVVAYAFAVLWSK